MTEGWMSGSQGIVVFSTLILLVYDSCLPGHCFISPRSGSCLGYRCSFLSARWGFVAGWLSSFANTYFHDMIRLSLQIATLNHKVPSRQFLEEPLLIPIFLCSLSVQCPSDQWFFFLAIASGLGFRSWRTLPIFVRSARWLFLHGVRNSRSQPMRPWTSLGFHRSLSCLVSIDCPVSRGRL